ncbi:glycosyltransferase 48 kDa subunit-like protein [Striga asiatica]|uniref:Glycosyltransferase 48 kDa subunit-like protein n=1 Tax=Striga asiatica TaxID=4170 RepID=A0A5A7PRK3_STRAF|nr:glycosyltransferase 48 kDa subunit-like protein [Striga asiatica]
MISRSYRRLPSSSGRSKRDGSTSISNSRTIPSSPCGDTGSTCMMSSSSSRRPKDNTRILISGSLSMFSNRFFRSGVQKAGVTSKLLVDPLAEMHLLEGVYFSQREYCLMSLKRALQGNDLLCRDSEMSDLGLLDIESLIKHVKEKRGVKGFEGGDSRHRYFLSERAGLFCEYCWRGDATQSPPDKRCGNIQKHHGKSELIISKR